MRLILVRHGETAHNRDGIVQGRQDVPLSERGRRQAAALAADLQGHGIAAIYTSPLQRARETAAIVADAIGLTVTIDEGLTEMDVGELDGLTLADMRTRFRTFLDGWRTDVSGTTPLPCSESLTAVQERAWAAVQRMLTRHPSDLVLAVSHQFAIQTILCRVMAMPLINFERVRLAPAGKTLVEVSSRTSRLLYLNDCCHHPPEP
jgi:broad specificity phosphatase PhoE